MADVLDQWTMGLEFKRLHSTVYSSCHALI